MKYESLSRQTISIFEKGNSFPERKVLICALTDMLKALTAVERQGIDDNTYACHSTEMPTQQTSKHTALLSYMYHTAEYKINPYLDRGPFWCMQPLLSHYLMEWLPLREAERGWKSMFYSTADGTTKI
jgi:hypothetical protein